MGRGQACALKLFGISRTKPSRGGTPRLEKHRVNCRRGSLAVESLEPRHVLSSAPLYLVDVGVEASPEPQAGGLPGPVFAPLVPGNASIYSHDAFGSIQTASEQDVFVLQFDPNQSVAVQVRPFGALVPTVTLTGHSGDDILLSDIASGPLRPAIITPYATNAGEYRITVSGNGSTTGVYQLKILINAGFELEEAARGENNSPENAENLDEAFFSFAATSAEQASVIGSAPATRQTIYTANMDSDPGWTLDGGTGSGFWEFGPPGADPNDPSAAFSGTNSIGYGLSTVAPPTYFERLYATMPPLDLREAGNVRIDFQGALYAEANGSSFEVSTIDGDWHALREETAVLERLWREHSYTLPSDVLTHGATRFRWGIGPTGNLSSGGWTIDDVTVAADVPSSADWYKFSLEDGQLASLAVTSHTQQQAFLQLYDSTGTTLLVDPMSGQPGSESIDAFRDLTDDGVPTNYLVRVTAINTAYSLVVLRDSQLENDYASSADEPQHLWPTSNSELHVRGYLQADSVSSSNEIEPNDDGQFGADANDLPHANDVSSYFSPLGTDNYRAEIRGSLATTSFDDELDVFRFSAGPGDSMVIDMLGFDSGAGTLSDPTLTLVDEAGNLLAFNDDRDSTTYDARIFYDSFPRSGNYYVFAESFFFGDPGSYLLRLTLRSDTFATSADWYSFSASAGDTITLALNVPGNEGNLPENFLQPQWALLPPDGAAAIHGSDTMDYPADRTGTYLVRVSIDRTARGSYVLDIDGASPAAGTFSVVGHDLPTPYWQSAPSSITLEFDDIFRLDTLEPADFQINGQDASSAYLIDSRHVRIALSPDMLDDANTLSISSGALTNIRGVPIEPYHYEFLIDGDRPTVTSVSIAENEILLAEFAEITVQFSETLRLDLLGPEDMRLIDFNNVPISPIAWEYDDDALTLTIQYPPLDDSRYQLVLRSGAEAFADLVGNPLLGSPEGQNDYVRSFVIDEPAYSLTDSFQTLSPTEILGREQLRLGDLSFAGDVDRYEVSLAAGQVISVAVQMRSPITASVTITRPDGETITGAEALAPGRSAVISSVRAESAGVYGIEIRDLANSTGGYQLRVGLDLLFEPEEVGGTANNTASSPTRLDDVFVHVEGTQIQRALVRGISDFQIEAMIPTNAYWQYHHEIEAPGDNWNEPYFDDGDWRIGQAELGYGDGDENTVLESGELFYIPYVTSYFRYHYPADRDPSRYLGFRINGRHDDGIAVYMNGTELVRVAIPPDATHSTPSDPVSDNATLLRTISLANLPPATLVVGQNVIAAEVHQYVPSTDLSFRARVDLLLSQASYQDWYEVSLADGESLSLFLEPLTDSPLNLALYGSDGTELLANGSVTAEGTLAIDGFTDTTSNGDDDTYLILITGQSTRYSLAALRDATLDVEPNNTVAQAQWGTQSLGTIAGNLTGAATLLEDFAGMNSFSTECGCEPPDTHVAVGLEHVVEVVNTAIAVYSKRGEPLAAPTEFSNFFNSDVVQGNEFLFDPVVAYDAMADRFVVAILTAASSFDSESDLLYAVSNTGDPTQGWDEQHRIDLGGVSPNLFADYPKIGLNADGHVITLNMFSFFSFDHVDVVVIDKTSVLDSNPETFASNILSRPPESFTMAAATMHESQPGDPMWFVEETAYGTGGDTLRVVRLDNMLDDTATFHDFEIPVTAYELGPFATQPGGIFNTGDSRMLNAAWRRGRLVTTHVIGLQDRAVAKWYEFNTNGATPSLVQEVVVDQGAAVDTFYPAIDINRAGDVGLTFLQSSATQYVSMYVVGQPSDSAPGTQGIAARVAEGNVTYTGGRGGDYAGIGVDPVTDSFWSANEVILGGANNPLWSTWIGEFIVAPIADEDWYWFAANTGDDIAIELTKTFVNATSGVAAWLPAIEVYGPDHMLVASAQLPPTEDTLRLSFAPTTSGSYRIRVQGQEASRGTYALAVSGATATRPAPFVLDMEPNNGALVAELPTEIRFRFSEGFRASSIDTNGFSIAGMPVDEVTLVDSVTLLVTLPSDFALPDGEVAIVIQPGAVVGLSGSSNDLFQGRLVLDTTAPQLVDVTWNGASLPANSRVTAAQATLSLVFNEPLFTLSSARRGLRTPGTDDVLLQHRNTGAIIRPLEMSYVTGSDTVHATFNELPEGDYELRIVSGRLAFEDRVGHALDGEFNDTTTTGVPSGDGSPGGDFLLPFYVDADSTSITTLSPILPLGTYASQYETTGYIQYTTDIDQFTLAALAGESVTLVVTPAEPSAVLTVNDHVASAPGDSVLLVTSLQDSRTLTWNLSSDTQTQYRLEMFRNVSAQHVTPAGPDNSYRIDDSGLVLGDGARYIVVGELEPIPVETTTYENQFEVSLGGFVIDNDVGVGGGLWHRSTGRSSDGLPNHSPNFSLYFGQLESATSGGDYDRGHIRGDVRSPVISIPAAGSPQLVFSHLLDREETVLWDLAEVLVESDSGTTTLLSTSTGSLANTAGTWQQVVASLEPFRGETIRIRFSFDTVDELSNTYEGWFIDDFRVVTSLEPIHDVQRYYVDLSDFVGQTVDVLLTSQDDIDMSEVELSLLTSQGELSGGFTYMTQQSDANYSRAVMGTVVPEMGANDFFVEIDSRVAGRFALVITAGVAFELEPNNMASEVSRPINTSGWLLAHSDAANDSIDLFAVDVTENQPVLVTRHASLIDSGTTGAGELEWLFDPESFTLLELPGFLPSTTRENAVLLLPNFSGLGTIGTQLADGQRSYQLELDFAVGNGDVNGDEVIDCNDLSLIVDARASGIDNATSDISQDGHVDSMDLALWFILAANVNLPGGQPYRTGDVNLDGVVDAVDLQTLQANLFTANPYWCQGDLNFDGSVDGRDFNDWQRHKFTGIADATSRAAVGSRTPRAPLGSPVPALPPARVDALPRVFDLGVETRQAHVVSTLALFAERASVAVELPPTESLRSRLAARDRRRHEWTDWATRDVVFAHEDLVQEVAYGLSHSSRNSSFQ